MSKIEVTLTKEEKELIIERISIINKIQSEIAELRRMLEENINYLNAIWSAAYRRELIEKYINSSNITAEVPSIIRNGKLSIEFKEPFNVVVYRSEEDG